MFSRGDAVGEVQPGLASTSRRPPLADVVLM